MLSTGAPPTSVRVRRARAEDLAAAGAVTVAAYAPFTRGPEDPYVARLADAAARQREAELWVALGDGEVVLGSVTWCPTGSPWREVARTDEGEFRMLAVAPSAQGAGVGRALVEAMVGLAVAQGSTGVAISSLRAMVGAHRLYGRLGFTRLPSRDWAPLPGVDLIAFHKEL